MTYASSGVDVDAGERAVALMAAAVARTHGPEVVGGLGGFAGLLDVSAVKDLRRPLLATSTDGVGTKTAIARALGVHDTIGVDLVAMTVDDVVVCGARPLFLTDYIACGRLVPERIAAIVSGIARGCQDAGCALLGGETAEHPGLLAEDEYDLAGAATGVVEADAVLGPHRVRDGDAVIAIASSGLHANGYSLVRRILQVTGTPLERHVAELGRTLGEELLTPTAIYAPDLLRLARRQGSALHALAHVTGGGLAANLARVIPPGLAAVLERATWSPPPVVRLLARLGDVPPADLERTVNLGIGMVAVVDDDAADETVGELVTAGRQAWILGAVRTGERTAGAGARVVLVGEHPRPS